MSQKVGSNQSNLLVPFYYLHVITHNTGSIAILVFPFIYNFLLYVHHIMLLNVELDVRGYQRIVFQGSDIIDGHYCQLCIPIYMQFPSLFTHCAVSNCKIDIIGYQMIAFKVYDNIFERHVFCNSIGAQNDRIDLVIAI